MNIAGIPSHNVKVMFWEILMMCWAAGIFALVYDWYRRRKGM